MSAEAVVGQDAEILGLAREFAAGEVTPNAAAWDAARELPDAFVATLAEMGFFGMPVSEEFGGLGLSARVYHQVLAVLAEADPSVALTVAAHGVVAQVVQRFAPAEVARELLPQMAAGERIGASALLESGTDADPTRFSTRMAADGVIGIKRGVVNASRASIFLVGAAAEGDTVLALVPDNEDARIIGRATTMGFSATEFAEVEFSAAEVLARLGDTKAVLLTVAAFERAAIAAVAIGIVRGSLQDALRYSQERSQFGSPLSGFGAIQAKLAEMGARGRGCEATLNAFAESLDDDATEDGVRDADGAALKILASECAMFASDEAVQIFGGYGYMRDYPVEKRMRDAKGTEVLGGTSEALKRVLAARLLEGC